MKHNKILAVLLGLILSLSVVFSFSGCFLFETPEEDEEYTITFDAGEYGSLATTTLTTEGGKLETLPTPTADENYTFLGWFTSETGGAQVTDGHTFTADSTLYAHYQQKPVTPAPEVEYTVTFNVGTHGTLPAGTSATLTTVKGKLSSLPTPTVKDGYTFLGWFTSETGGTRVTASYTFTAKTTLYAHYSQTAQPAEKVDPTQSANFLKTDGKEVTTTEGKTVYLRGVNAGGLFVTEPWMTVFGSDENNKDHDYKSITQKFIERFGADKTKELWAEYRANWWTEQDFQNCADMGMTVIRLPFTYMNVDFDAVTDYANAGKNYDFSDLDAFVNKAAEYGLYTILDLHGTYGSQNGQHHSGEILDGSAEDNEVDFYSNEQMQTLTVKLWGELSKHYKDNPAVAGYDILNEPGEKGGWIWDNADNGYKHWRVFDNIYKAIRETGDEHIVMFESCWGEYNLPAPSQYGWENCMYSFHHYVTWNLSVDDHMSNWEEKLSGIEGTFNDRNYNVPLQMGEFTAYDSAEKWEQTLELLNSHNWHYTSWTYKVWNNGATGWGIYNVKGDKVDAVNDSYDSIIGKFASLRTENGKEYSNNGKTIKSIFKEKLTGTVEPSVTINKVGLISDGGKAYAIFSGTCTINNMEELAAYVIDGEINTRIKLTLEIIGYDATTGAFKMKADLSVFNTNGNYWLHAGFDSRPENLPVSSAQIDGANATVTVNGKKYSFTESSGCRQIKVAAA